MGYKARITALQPLAIYIHYSNHALNLALQDLAKKIPLIRDCLQWANDVGLILKASEKRKLC